jgi:DNA-binding MarR family transcriptional regulator
MTDSTKEDMSLAEEMAKFVIRLRRKCDYVESQSCSKFGSFTRSQQNVLLYIGCHPHCTMTKIAGTLGHTLSTTTSIVDKLVRCEYVERHRDDSDRRIVKVALTKKGETLYNEAYQSVIEFCNIFLSSFAKDEKKTFISFYERAVGHLEM